MEKRRHEEEEAKLAEELLKQEEAEASLKKMSERLEDQKRKLKSSKRQLRRYRVTIINLKEWEKAAVADMKLEKRRREMGAETEKEDAQKNVFRFIRHIFFQNT